MIDYPFKKNKMIENKTYCIEKVSKIKKTNKNNFKKKLGFNLEQDINFTNQFYKINNIALIFKNEIPIQIVKVDYPKRQKAKIVEAYYRLHSLPDYQGLYKGKYLCFDVKETNHKTCFPLKNIPLHQISYLQQIEKFNGISFFIIHFKQHNKYFYLPISFLTSYLKQNENKNINYKIFQQKLFIIPSINYPRIDYLSIVDYFIK